MNMLSPSQVIILRYRLFFTCVAIFRPLYENLQQQIKTFVIKNYINLTIQNYGETLTLSNTLPKTPTKLLQCPMDQEHEESWHMHISNKLLTAQVKLALLAVTSINKQLLDEVERDIMNYQNRGLYYLPKPKAKADNTDTRF